MVANCWVCRKDDPHCGEALLRPLLTNLKRRRVVQDCPTSCQELQSRSDHGFASTSPRAGITVRITSIIAAVNAAQGTARNPARHQRPMLDPRGQLLRNSRKAR